MAEEKVKQSKKHAVNQVLSVKKVLEFLHIMNFMETHILGSLLQLNIYNPPNSLQIKAYQPGLPHAIAKIILDKTLDIVLKCVLLYIKLK